MSKATSLLQSKNSNFLAPAYDMLQRKCDCGNQTVASGECGACSKKRQILQRRAVNSQNEQAEVPPIVHEVLRSAGQSLDHATRSFMEPRFGYDFSHVRVHTDAKAGESARAVNALAYTVGRDVVFRGEHYAPGLATGRQLLAHELAHVFQQQSSDEDRPELASLRITDPADVSERVAENIAKNALAFRPVRYLMTGRQNRSLYRRQPDADPNHREPTTRRLGQPLPYREAMEATERGLYDEYIRNCEGVRVLEWLDRGEPRTPLERIRRLERRLKQLPKVIKIWRSLTDPIERWEWNEVQIVPEFGPGYMLGSEEEELTKARCELSKAKWDLVAESRWGHIPGRLLRKKNRPDKKNGSTRLRDTAEGQGPAVAVPATPNAKNDAPANTADDTAQNVRKRKGTTLPRSVATQKSAPAAVGQIKELTELIKKTSDAVTRDPLITKLRGLLSGLQPFIPAREAKQMIDDAIRSFIKDGADDAIMAILKAITGKSPSTTPENRNQTGPNVPPKDLGEQIFQGPKITIKDAPAPASVLSFQYRHGPGKYYKAGDTIRFTLVPPANFSSLRGAKRLVIVAKSDRNDPNPVRLARIDLETTNPTAIELQAPRQPGKYVIRVDIGLGFDFSNMQEFEVSAPQKK